MGWGGLFKFNLTSGPRAGHLAIRNALPENRQGAGVGWVTCCKQRHPKAGLPLVSLV